MNVILNGKLYLIKIAIILIMPFMVYADESNITVKYYSEYNHHDLYDYNENMSFDDEIIKYDKQSLIIGIYKHYYKVYFKKNKPIKAEQILNNSNDIIETYYFNENGRTIRTVSKSSASKIEYSKNKITHFHKHQKYGIYTVISEYKNNTLHKDTYLDEKKNVTHYYIYSKRKFKEYDKNMKLVKERYKYVIE